MRLLLKTSFLTWKHESLQRFAQGSGIARATLYRWLKRETLPRWSQVLQLAEAADLDPTLLLDFQGQAPMDVVREVAAAVFRGKGHDHADLVEGIIGRYLFSESEWPPDDFFPGHPWTRHVARHDAAVRQDYWGTFRIRVAGDREGPQSWHFAWRNTVGATRPWFWVPYGIATRFKGEVELEHFNGQRQRQACPGTEFVVETWFGKGSADFCVASLHPFEMRLLGAHEPRPLALPRVRFGEIDATREP